MDVSGRIHADLDAGNPSGMTKIGFFMCAGEGRLMAQSLLVLGGSDAEPRDRC
jgi:hypothetical protein